MVVSKHCRVRNSELGTQREVTVLRDGQGERLVRARPADEVRAVLANARRPLGPAGPQRIVLNDPLAPPDSHGGPLERRASPAVYDTARDQSSCLLVGAAQPRPQFGGGGHGKVYYDVRINRGRARRHVKAPNGRLHSKGTQCLVLEADEVSACRNALEPIPSALIGQRRGRPRTRIALIQADQLHHRTHQRDAGSGVEHCTSQDPSWRLRTSSRTAGYREGGRNDADQFGARPVTCHSPTPFSEVESATALKNASWHNGRQCILCQCVDAAVS